MDGETANFPLPCQMREYQLKRDKANEIQGRLVLMSRGDLFEDATSAAKNERKNVISERIVPKYRF